METQLVIENLKIAGVSILVGTMILLVGYIGPIPLDIPMFERICIVTPILLGMGIIQCIIYTTMQKGTPITKTELILLFVALVCGGIISGVIN